MVSAPLRWSRSCARTRSGARTRSQARHVALALVTVPEATSFSLFGVKTSNSIWGVLPLGLRILTLSARNRAAFLQSQKERTSGISAPQFGDSHVTVRAHRYAIGVAPSGSGG